jgi:hypothetical protein
MENIDHQDNVSDYHQKAAKLSLMGHGTVTFIKQVGYKQVVIYALYLDPKEMTMAICQELIDMGVFPCGIFKEKNCVLLVADIGYKNYLEDMYYRECILAEEAIKNAMGKGVKYVDDLFLEEMGRSIVDAQHPYYSRIQELIKI